MEYLGDRRGENQESKGFCGHGLCNGGLETVTFKFVPWFALEIGQEVTRNQHQYFNREGTERMTLLLT